jgi:hypothetical protein
MLTDLYVVRELMRRVTDASYVPKFSRNILNEDYLFVAIHFYRLLLLFYHVRVRLQFSSIGMCQL